MSCPGTGGRCLKALVAMVSQLELPNLVYSMILCKVKMKKSLKKVSCFQAGVCSLPSPPSAHHLSLWDVGCCHSIKPFLAAATFPPDLGHVECSTGKSQIRLHMDDTNAPRKFLSVLALDGDSKSLFCLRTGCWHLLSQCQLYSCLSQNFLSPAMVLGHPSPKALAPAAAAVCSFSLFFDRSAASGRGT